MRVTLSYDFWFPVLQANADIQRDRKLYAMGANTSAGMRMELGANYYLDLAERRNEKKWLRLSTEFWSVVWRATDSYQAHHFGMNPNYVLKNIDVWLESAEREVHNAG